MIDMHMRQQHRRNALGRQRRWIPISRLKASLLKHPAIDHYPLASDFEAVATTRDLAISTEKVKKHRCCGDFRVQRTKTLLGRAKVGSFLITDGFSKCCKGL